MKGIPLTEKEQKAFDNTFKFFDDLAKGESCQNMNTNAQNASTEKQSRKK